MLEREGTSAADLEAEIAENMELGLRFVSPRFNASAVYFDNEFNNRLEFFGPQIAGNIPNYTIGLAGRYDNVGGIGSNGFELAGTVELNDNWSLYASYTNTDATYIGTGLGADADAAIGIVAGNKVVATPETMWVASLDWTRDQYFAGLSTKFVGDRFMDRANAVVAEEYTVSDLYVGIDGDSISEALKSFEFRFVVNNVFDESYLGGIAAWGAWIGPPRTASFAMTVDF